MAMQFNVEMPTALTLEFYKTADEDRQTLSEVMTRAVVLYFLLRKEVRHGLVLGFVDPDKRDQLKQEIWGE